MCAARFTDVLAALTHIGNAVRPTVQWAGRIEGLPRLVVGVERLEGRRLFAVDAGIVNNVLVVTGTSGADDLTVYQIDAATDQVFVDLNGGTDDAGPFSVNSFNSISMTGGAGADKLVVSSASQMPYGDMAVTKPAFIGGANGNDTVWGGDGNDTLWGDAGDDEVRGHGGNDGAYGGYGGVGSETGNDQIFGGTGSDTLWGEGGDDFLDATDGSGENDVVNGGDGTNDFGSVDGDDSVTNVEFT